LLAPLPRSGIGTTPFAIVAAELIADLGKPASEVRAAANY
jgi:hypothetical protein